MNLEILRELAISWEERASRLDDLGAGEVAECHRTMVAEYREKLQEWSNEVLTMEEASRESGYSRDSLRRHIREDKIPNAGDQGRPRIRRCDLPCKPGHRVPEISANASDQAEKSVPSRSQMARSVVDSD